MHVCTYTHNFPVALALALGDAAKAKRLYWNHGAFKALVSVSRWSKAIPTRADPGSTQGLDTANRAVGASDRLFFFHLSTQDFLIS